MKHSTTPKLDRASDHLAGLNAAIDEVLSTKPVGTPWLLGGNVDSITIKLTKLYAQRDKAIKYMRRFIR